MRNLILAIFISMFFFGCYKESEQSRIVHRVTDSFTEDVKRSEGFHLNGYGGRIFPIVRTIDLSYVAKRKVDLPEARRLLVKNVTKLLKNINESEELKQYLSHYPYTSYGIRFAISFRDEEMNQFTDGSIASVYFIGSNDPNRTYILYKVFSLEKLDLEEIHEETYEEAERIVNGGD